MIKSIVSRILSVTGPGRIIHAGATNAELLTELLLTGCDAWAVSEQPFAHPRCLKNGDPTVLTADTIIYETNPASPQLMAVNTSRDPDNLVIYGGGFNRRTLENVLFGAGWRRHPGGMVLEEFERLTDDALQDLSFYQKVPEGAATSWPVESLQAERDLHMDMLRESGARADAHVARYVLAAQFVRPGDKVLDCACGLGYGTSVLASRSRGETFLGVDVDENVIAYATANFGRAGISYSTGDAADLRGIADNSIDMVVSFDTLECVQNWHAALAEFERVLRPDGRIIASVPNRWVDQTGRDPNPHHFHAFDWSKFADGLEQHFILEKRYIQATPGGFKLHEAPRMLQPMPLNWTGDSEWVLVVASMDPRKATTKEGYTNPEFQPAFAASGQALLDYAGLYDNPYLIRSMVYLGQRLHDTDELTKLAESVLETARPGSADQGGALCVLGYRALEQRQVNQAQHSLERIRAYRSDSESELSNSQVLRWRISLFYLAGRLAEMLGALDQAKDWLRLTAETDWRDFSPLIATKTVSACFQLGVLSIVSSGPQVARPWFERGVQQALLAARSDPHEIVGSLVSPVPFGLEELTQITEMGLQCSIMLLQLDAWERDRGAFWRNVDFRRFGMHNWANEMQLANEELRKRLNEERLATQKTTDLSQRLLEQLKNMTLKFAQVSHSLSITKAAANHMFASGEIRSRIINGQVIRYLAAEGSLSNSRFESLFDKEPETIEWIDSFKAGETLWDIGANIGIYSIYAALRGVKVLSFEPHFASYFQLCANILLNNLQSVITTYCLAIAERKTLSTLNLAKLEFGSSQASFGGDPAQPAFQQGMMGYSIDALIEDFHLDVPNHLKIDAGNTELNIVWGAKKTLAHDHLRSVLIELVDTAQIGGVTGVMAAAGISLAHQKPSSPPTAGMNFLYQRPEPKQDGQTIHEVGDARILAVAEPVIARMVSKIEAAPLDEQPDQNIYMEEIFDPAIYAELLARLPKRDAYGLIDHPDARTETGVITRLLFDLTDETLSRFSPEDRDFWRMIKTATSSDTLQKALLRKFHKRVSERFGDHVPELVTTPVFYRDFPGYFIGVHPDGPMKVATMQLYLPADNSQIHLGTSFHRKDGDTFPVLKTNLFKPNSGYAFVRTECSWHSVKRMGPNEKERNTLALTVYLKGKEYRASYRLTDLSQAQCGNAIISTPAVAEPQVVSLI